MKASVLLAWQNLIFILPMAFALILLAVSMMGGSDHDHDHDLPGHSAVHGADGIHEGADASFLSRILDLFGVGRVPLSILIFTWCMLFGFIGLALQHYFLSDIVPARTLNAAVSAGAAFFVSGALTSMLSRLIGRFMPRLETYGERKQDFINREAEVRYTIREKSGTVTLFDKYGNLQQLEVHLHPSCTAHIPPHTRVILLAYDPAEEAFLAVPSAQLIPGQPGIQFSNS